MAQRIEHCQDAQGKAVKPVSSRDKSVDCERPYMSPQEARLCSADPDIVCAERSRRRGRPGGAPPRMRLGAVWWPEARGGEAAAPQAVRHVRRRRRGGRGWCCEWRRRRRDQPRAQPRLSVHSMRLVPHTSASGRDARHRARASPGVQRRSSHDPRRRGSGGTGRTISQGWQRVVDTQHCT